MRWHHERLAVLRAPLPAWHHAPPVLREYGRKSVEYCERKGVDIASLAIRFCVENPDLTTTVAGTANPANREQRPLWSRTLTRSGFEGLILPITARVDHARMLRSHPA